MFDKKNILQSDYKSFNDDMDQEAFVRSSVNFLRDLGIISENDLNAMILQSYAVSKHIKHVEMFVDKKRKNLTIQLFLGRLGFIFCSRRKMIKRLAKNIREILIKEYTLNIEVRLFRYDKKEEKENR